MYLLYSALLLLAAIVAAPYFLYRSLVTGKYWPSFKERLGFIPETINPEGRPAIWIHAVSVGEVLTVKPLLPLLRESFPGLSLYVSSTTLTGKRLAERELKEADGVFYCPFDFRFAVRPVVRRVKPRLLAIVETEIWPHLLSCAREAGARTMLVNGRISDRSYPRYSRVKPLLRPFLLSIDHFCMQNELYAGRIRALGAPPERVSVTGSVKFDAVAGSVEPSRALDALPKGRRLLVAGSTMAPEEEILLDVFSAIAARYPDVFLVLAPRHPERFSEVAELVRARGIKVARRTEVEDPGRADVLVLDTIGELASVYGAGEIVFVGGSLAAWGGHNVIEPAALARPILFGPHMANFAEIRDLFLGAGAAIQVRDRDDLQQVVQRLLGDPTEARALGDRARRLVEANRGASRKTLEVARRLLDS